MLKRVDVVYTLVTNAVGEVLLVRNRDGWSLPGGEREDGETLPEAAQRETKEEAHVVVRVGALVHVAEVIGAEVHDVFHVFRAELEGDAEPFADGLDADVEEVAWVPVDVADERMPWYDGGVSVLLTSGGAGYSASRA
ncbi:NUDIX hydrolase [Streptomyces sp. H39-S7]|uniref:NUDIX hydrolase n=1 Tax=Streptomyces sp. H39-S7 TaxID=3004357 RepID=UPI0022AF7074|nr:NUDIX hydrolase [Streptomyces sp. H39-S7]MCZ4126180.1 NUDIX hydrolase [Streptomyces sp. H39-S7]